MIFKQFYLGSLSQASYLIGDEHTGTAVVVDPRRDVDEYLEEARRLGLRIEHVILTHFHADFVAGHLELRERANVTIQLGARAQAEYDFYPLHEGDALELGSVRLEVLETPGHTPESISIVVYDLAVSRHTPHAVLTGDTLLIGDVGRPDVVASAGIAVETLAGMLYDSLHEKLLRLPDDTLLYPGHGAGFACGKNLSTETVSTIGSERTRNAALRPMSKDEFVRIIAMDRPETPAYFRHDADLNRQEHPTLEATLGVELKPLALSTVIFAQRAGAQILDTRDPADFAAGHLMGSTNIGLDGRFASWAGTLLSAARPIVLVTAPGRERETAMHLGRVGFENIVGFLAGGITAVRRHGTVVQHPVRLTAVELRERLAGEPAPALIDVRAEAEWRQDGLPGSMSIPLQHLRSRAWQIPVGAVIVYCRTGEQSSTAASLLEQMGRLNVLDLAGGLMAWRAAGLSATVAREISGPRSDSPETRSRP